MDKNDSDSIKYTDLYGLCSTEFIDIPDILSPSEVYNSFLCLFIPNIDGVYHLWSLNNPISWPHSVFCTEQRAIFSENNTKWLDFIKKRRTFSVILTKLQQHFDKFRFQDIINFHFTEELKKIADVTSNFDLSECYWAPYYCGILRDCRLCQ